MWWWTPPSRWRIRPLPMVGVCLHSLWLTSASYSQMTALESSSKETSKQKWARALSRSSSTNWWTRSNRVLRSRFRRVWFQKWTKCSQVRGVTSSYFPISCSTAPLLRDLKLPSTLLAWAWTGSLVWLTTVTWNLKTSSETPQMKHCWIQICLVTIWAAQNSNFISIKCRSVQYFSVTSDKTKLVLGCWPTQPKVTIWTWPPLDSTGSSNKMNHHHPLHQLLYRLHLRPK